MGKNHMNSKLSKILIAFFLLLFLADCSKGFFKKVDNRKKPVNMQERARQNVEQGKGVSINKLLARRGNTNFQFSSSNPMWRASLETLDFMPMTTVDYAGGMIISDWYSDNSGSSNESLKITVRFLSNEVQSNSLKIIVHNKKCKTNEVCSINEIDSNIKFELQRSILAKAAALELETKKSKK